MAWIKSRNARRSGRGGGMTCRRGLAVRDFLAVLDSARVERALRVEATISVGTEIVAQALQQIGRAASATQPL